MANDFDPGKLIGILNGKGISPDQIAKQLGLPKEIVNEYLVKLGLAVKPNAPKVGPDPKPPTTPLPPRQDRSAPDVDPPDPRQPNGPSKPGVVGRLARSAGEMGRESVARHVQRHGVLGEKIAGKIRGKQGVKEHSPATSDKAVAASIDHATQVITAGMAELGTRIEKVLAKVDYGVRESTGSIVDELTRIAKAMNTESYKQEEDDAEASMVPDEAGGGDVDDKKGGGIGKVLGGLALAGAGAAAATMLSTSPANGGTTAEDLKKEEEKTKQDSTPAGDVEMKADKMTFTADEAVFSDAILRALGGGGGGGGAIGGPTMGPNGAMQPSPGTGERVGGGNLSGGSPQPGETRAGVARNGKAATGTRAQNQKEFYDSLIKEGATPAQARILTANVTGESIDDPTNYHWDRSHMSGGIAQWDPERSEAIKKKFGAYPWQLSTADQAKALWWETNNNPRFKKTKDALNDPNLPDAEKMQTTVSNLEAPADTATATAQRLQHLSGLDKSIEKWKQEDAAKAAAKPPTPSPASPMDSENLDARMSGTWGKSSADATPVPNDDENLAARMSGTWGKHIDDASTDQKAAQSAPTVVPLSDDAFNKRAAGAAAPPSTTKDDDPDDKDKAPPPTSKEDHFKDFPGIGRTRAAGLGM